MSIEFDIREPAVAGQFYPGTFRSLNKAVKNAMSGSDWESLSGKVRALLTPHAGYSFSGSTAGQAYGLLTQTDQEYDRVLVLAPAHTVPFRTIAVGPFSAYRTPLGDMPVASQSCGHLLDASSLFSLREDAHRREHALEVQLPFLQSILPDAQLVPLVCGQLNRKDLQTAADVLARELWEPRTLWVISSDFTHYGASFGYLPFVDNIPENLKELDLGAVDLIKQKDPNGFLDYLDRTGATICGQAPISILLFVLQNSRELISPELIEYNTSGAITGDYSHCVSYVSMTFLEE